MPQDNSIPHRAQSSGLAFLPVAGSVWLWLLAARHLLYSMQASEVWMPSSPAMAVYLLLSVAVTVIGSWALGEIRSLYHWDDDGKTPVGKKIAAIVFVFFCRVVLTTSVLPIMLAVGAALGTEKSWIGIAVLAAGMAITGLSSFHHFRVRDFIRVRGPVISTPVRLAWFGLKAIFRALKSRRSSTPPKR